MAYNGIMQKLREILKTAEMIYYIEEIHHICFIIS